MHSNDIPIVFTVLLEKCVSDLYQGATVLLSRIQEDMGNGHPLSASSLAQSARHLLEHVERLRYTKALFHVPPLPPTAARLSTRYNGLQNRFRDEIVSPLIAIAIPEDDSPAAQKGLLDKLRQKLAAFVPGEVIDAAEEAELRVSLHLTDFVSHLEEIIKEARLLLVEINQIAEKTLSHRAPT
jgi:hypothetical protein